MWTSQTNDTTDMDRKLKCFYLSSTVKHHGETLAMTEHNILLKWHLFLLVLFCICNVFPVPTYPTHMRRLYLRSMNMLYLRIFIIVPKNNKKEGNYVARRDSHSCECVCHGNRLVALLHHCRQVTIKNRIWRNKLDKIFRQIWLGVFRKIVFIQINPATSACSSDFYFYYLLNICSFQFHSDNLWSTRLTLLDSLTWIPELS